MPPKNTKILGFKQYHKSDKAPAIISADIECSIKKIDICKTNPKVHSVIQCLR